MSFSQFMESQGEPVEQSQSQIESHIDNNPVVCESQVHAGENPTVTDVDKSHVEQTVLTSSAAEDAPVAKREIHYLETEKKEEPVEPAYENKIVWRTRFVVERIDRFSWAVEHSDMRAGSSYEIVKSFEQTKEGLWPPRQEVHFAIPESNKERIPDENTSRQILFPEIHLFLDDITLQEDGSVVFNAEISALLRRSLLERSGLENIQGKAESALCRKKEHGYTRPSLTPLVADHIPANVVNDNSIDNVDFVSEIRTRLTLSEMVISTEDWSWGDDGKLTLNGLAASTLLSGAHLWIPKEDPVLRDHRAMRSTSSTGSPIKIDGQIDLLWTLLSKRNRVWIVDCHQSFVKINFTLTEELDDARMAHEKGIRGLNSFLNLGIGDYNKPCCDGMLGGPSLHGRLETLVFVACKAASDEQRQFANSVPERRTSPFLHMFENSQPRTEDNSRLEQAIRALRNVDRKVSRRRPYQRTLLRLRKRNLDVTSPLFDLSAHMVSKNRVIGFLNKLKREASEETVRNRQPRMQTMPVNQNPRETFVLFRMKTAPFSFSPGWRTQEGDDYYIEPPTLMDCCGKPFPKLKGRSEEVWDGTPPAVVQEEEQAGEQAFARYRGGFLCTGRQFMCLACFETPDHRMGSSSPAFEQVPMQKNIIYRTDWDAWKEEIKAQLEADAKVKAQAEADAEAKRKAEEKEEHSPPMEFVEGQDDMDRIPHGNGWRSRPPLLESEVSMEETYRGEQWLRHSIRSISLTELSSEEEGEGDFRESPDTAPCGSVRSVEIGLSLKE